MRIVFFSPDEPLYLPGFYRYIFDNLGPDHEVQAVIVPPVYKNTTRLDLTLRYARVFGIKEAAYLSWKVVLYKIMDNISRANNERHYSLRSVLNKYNIPLRHEQDVNSRRNINFLRDWHADLVISVSCPQIFRKELISSPPRGCLNLHGSLLPDYRGVMPSFWVLANNEQEAGVTLFFINEKIDAGDVLVQRRYEISSSETLDSIIRRSKHMGAQMVLEGIDKIKNGSFETYSLDMSKGRYFGWPGRDDVKRFLNNGRRFR